MRPPVSKFPGFFRSRPRVHLALVRATYIAFGGAERIVNRIVGALAAEGVQVTILARHWWAEVTEALPSSVHWQCIDPFFSRCCLCRTNTHSSTDAWLVALACATRATAPIMRTRHISAPVPRNPASRWLFDRACSAIVTTGEKLRHDLIEVNGFTHVPIVSVPTGIDPERFKPGDPVTVRARLGLGEKFTIGIVATLRSWKGHRRVSIHRVTCRVSY